MSLFDSDDLPRLLERLYDAALDPHKWADFLKALPPSFSIICQHLGVSLFNDHPNITLLSTVPLTSLQAKHSKKYLRQLELLTPHLKRAVEIKRAMEGARRSNVILGATLDALGRAVFVLDRRGKVVDSNAQAQALLRGEDRPIRVDRFRVLRAGRREEDCAMSARVAALACSPQRATLPLRLVSNRTGTPYLAWLIPIAPPSRNGVPSQRQPLVEAMDNGPTILLLVSPASGLAEIPPEVIQAAFGLSSAEARLVSALVAGRSLGDYADRTGVSHNTVRNQLAAVFDRMGIRRRTDLVATIVDALGSAGGRGNGYRGLSELV